MIPPKRSAKSPNNNYKHSLKDAIGSVLRKCREPLSVTQITRKGQQMGLVNYSHKTNISKCIKKCLHKYKKTEFVQTSCGYYTLHDLHHMNVVCTMFLNLSTCV